MAEASANIDPSSDNGNGEDAISLFLSITGTTDSVVARQYLDMSGNKLDSAVNLFMEMNSPNGNNSRSSDDDQVADEQEEYQVPISSINHSDENEGVNDEDNASLNVSEPDYDYLAEEDENEDAIIEQKQEEEGEEDNLSDVASSPDYDYLGIDNDCVEPSSAQYEDGGAVGAPGQNSTDQVDTSNEQQHMEAKSGVEYCYNVEVEDNGEDYILGTLMVRVLQAKDLKVRFIENALNSK